MRLLLDTCVVSELRRSRGSTLVREAIMGRAAEDHFLSVLTLGEINNGIYRLTDAARQRELRDWLAGLRSQFSDRLLAVDGEVSLLWGQIDASARNRGITLPTVDGLIAATAIRHELVVATRNIRHFELAGAMVFDPWT